MSEMVKRHTKMVRLIHWTIALSGFALLFSGFGEMPMYKRYMLTRLPGMAWASNYEIHLVIHYIAGFFFTMSVCFHIIFHAMRKEFAAMPRKGDMKESWLIIKAMFKGGEEPPSGKFLAEQRVAYAALGVVSILLVITGLIKVYKNTGHITLGADFMMGVTLMHTACTMLFMVLVIFHLAAFLIKSNRPLFKSMFTGKVNKEYAKHRHSKWQID